MRRLQPGVFALLAGMYCSSGYASDYYGTVGLQQNKIQISNSSFEVLGPTAEFGRWLASGIGLELSAASSMSEKRQNDVTIKMDYLVSGGIRLESPLSGANSTAAYVLGGVATANLSGESSLGSTGGVSENSSGVYYGIGLLHEVVRGGYLSFEFTQYKLDKLITIPSINIGFRRNF